MDPLLPIGATIVVDQLLHQQLQPQPPVDAVDEVDQPDVVEVEEVKNEVKLRRSTRVRAPSKEPMMVENSELDKDLRKRKRSTKVTSKKNVKVQQVESEEVKEDDGSSTSTISVEAISEVVEGKIEVEVEVKKVEEKGKGKVAEEVKEEGDPMEGIEFIGDAINAKEAKARWPKRYLEKKLTTKKMGRKTVVIEDVSGTMQARCHYLKAKVDDEVYNLYDDVYVAGEREDYNYIGNIVEIFASTENRPYFTARWYYRAQDTVIGEIHSVLNEEKRVFSSDIEDVNPLHCLIKKLKIARVSPNIDSLAKSATIPADCDFYYDMHYSLPYSSFSNLNIDSTTVACKPSISSMDASCSYAPSANSVSTKMVLLDLYAGCGAMSTGLCLGANRANVNLCCGWAVDINEAACMSLKRNHPETEVRNESADNFFSLLKEWHKLCGELSLLGTSRRDRSSPSPASDADFNAEDLRIDPNDPSIDFEVEKVIDIRFWSPNEKVAAVLQFKVRWKGFSPDHDSWEPIKGLSNCMERVHDFIRSGYYNRHLPLPGDIDVICGGPPCQGASGFNRFRNGEDPLADSKNKQVIVFMDIVDFLKPKYVLMENVVDILKFVNGHIGRYALARLVGMNFQTRMGMMAAGCYGVPQFRMRVFLWGACPTKKLPQFPLPSHDLARVRGVTPIEFERNLVAYEENERPELEKALNLEDAITDLPVVKDNEDRDEMPYNLEPITRFQREIRLSFQEMLGTLTVKESPVKTLYDHRPLTMSKDDYQRVLLIPSRKGANFRDLPGLKVLPNNKISLDPEVERSHLSSGKPLVPDYAITFCKGSSLEPFRRLWWDETVPTVVTRAQPHNRAILHPVQNRVLTIRENARLQGFPDCYQLIGSVKDRYTQVGNAVAVPVARALGYALGLASTEVSTDEPILTLPPKFPNYLD